MTLLDKQTPKSATESEAILPHLTYLSKTIFQVGHNDNIFPGLTNVIDTSKNMGFTKEECQKIINLGISGSPRKAGISGSAKAQLKIRNVNEYNIGMSEDHTWIFKRIAQAVSYVNAELYKFDLTGIVHSLSLLHYTGSDKSHYTWHTDTGTGECATRKISVSVSLSDPGDYQGGQLIVNENGCEMTNVAHQGSIAMFPSFCLHTVTPVTQGDRWVLVAWVNGPRFK